MKKINIPIASLMMGTCFIYGSPVMAQGGGGSDGNQNRFKLEEITVTAERRSANLQDTAASVVAITGEDILNQGKITTQEILESIANVTFRDGGGVSPDGNIAIRGIQRTQQSRGVNDVLPSTTAVYVDGIYQGIGGNYDISRVEVLRGPQGTLYGRSATGGVVSFYTENPSLDEFGGNLNLNVGDYSLVDVQGAVNVPLSDSFAIRLAGHHSERDGYNPYDSVGGSTETNAARIKLLYKPSDELDVTAHVSIQEIDEMGGGYDVQLAAPHSYVYNNEDIYADPSPFPTREYSQYGLETNYDFGDSTLTWIAGYKDHKGDGPGPVTVGGKSIDRSDNRMPVNNQHTQEIRLASNTDEPFSWIVGANYYKHNFDHVRQQWQIEPILPNVTVTGGTVTEGDGTVVTILPGQYGEIEDFNNVLKNEQATDGNFENFGLFTEETFKLGENFRLTAGLRYDRTTLAQNMTYRDNENETPRLDIPGPPTSVVYKPEVYNEGALSDYEETWDNITYKLRMEYDLNPDQMVYFTTATGFQPGYAAVSPDNDEDGSVIFDIQILDQQELTSYEIGTKNVFFEDRLRLNAGLFYYDLGGYPEVISLEHPEGRGHPHSVVTIAMDVIGAEFEMDMLLTENDRLSFNAGYTKTQITDWQGTVVWSDGSETPSRVAAMLDEQPGHPELKATMAYEHSFNFDNGSQLVPRFEMVYTDGYYVGQINQYQIDEGQLPYNWQNTMILINAAMTWTSSDAKYSVSGWVRNALDTTYKAEVALAAAGEEGVDDIRVVTGDPMTFGLRVNMNF